ncbi:MAG TPA: restriction endonuclease [Geminicoccaceae bacterium]|nr:restriction endonuclease [Geminicoccaceae bacterium]
MTQIVRTDPPSPASPAYEVRDHDRPKPGDTFRDDVAAMLRADGWEVRLEVKVGSMRVDVLAEKRDFDRRRRLAVECKDWARPLNKDDLSHIKAKYDELVDNNDVDHILVVAPLPLAADPKAYVDRNPRLRFQTFAELVRSVFDAERYLRSLVDQFDEDGLASYYVPIRLDGNSNAEEAILLWLGADEHLFRRTGCDQVLSRTQFMAMRQLILQIDGLGSVITVTRQSGRPGTQVRHR